MLCVVAFELINVVHKELTNTLVTQHVYKHSGLKTAEVLSEPPCGCFSNPSGQVLNFWELKQDTRWGKGWAPPE